MERAFKASEKAAIWDASAASLENPAMLNTISDDHRGNGRIKHIPDMREKGRVRYGGRQYRRV